MVKLSNVLIGIVLVSLITTGMIIFLAGGSTKYSSTATNYNSSILATIQSQQSQITSDIANANNRLGNISATQSSGSNNFLNIVDFYFTAGYSSMKLVVNSVFTINTIGSSAIQGIPASSNYTNYLTTALISILMIVVIIGIIIYTITKSERM